MTRKTFEACLIIAVGISCITVLVQVLKHVPHGIQTKRQHPFSYYVSTHRRHPVSVADVSRIESWMTFDYITKAFGLPGEYLRDGLGISDPRYPFITITYYTHKHGLPTDAFLGRVQGSVMDYVTASSTLTK